MSTFEELRAAALRHVLSAIAFAPFVTTPTPGRVLLLVVRDAERRLALVTPEEAAPIVEHAKPPGEVLATLRSPPPPIDGAPALFWLVADLEGEAVYFSALFGAHLVQPGSQAAN